MREFLSDKKVIVIVAATALVVIGAFLIYGILVAPVRQPYRDALTQYNNVNRALAGTNVALNTTTATDDEFTKSIETLQIAFASLTTEADALGNQPVLEEGEGKTRYDTYREKLDGYIAYNKDVITSIEKVRPAFRACSADMSTVTENDAGLEIAKTCVKQFEAALDAPDSDYKELVGTFHRNYEQMVTIYQQMIALPDPEGEGAARYSELEEEREQLLVAFSTASDTFASNVQTHRNQVLTTDSAKKLEDYLTARSRIF